MSCELAEFELGVDHIYNNILTSVSSTSDQHADILNELTQAKLSRAILLPTCKEGVTEALWRTQWAAAREGAKMAPFKARPQMSPMRTASGGAKKRKKRAKKTAGGRPLQNTGFMEHVMSIGGDSNEARR